MAEVTLKRKVTLRKKETVAFTFTDKLKVHLIWDTQTDLDLCLFFKTKDGQEGGVFSNEYRNRRADLGSAESFPFIILGEDVKPVPNATMVEKINIYNLEQIEEAYVCAVNYDAAIEGRDVTFAEEGGKVELQSNTGDYLEVLADSTDHGPVYWVCTIKNRDGEYALKEEGKVLDLGGAFDAIPGFKLICN